MRDRLGALGYWAWALLVIYAMMLVAALVMGVIISLAEWMTIDSDPLLVRILVLLVAVFITLMCLLGFVRNTVPHRDPLDSRAAFPEMDER